MGEYSTNGHYLGGPQLAQPQALIRMISDAQVTAPPDLQREQAARQIAADRTAYRQGLPVPTVSALAASTRARRRKGLGRGGYLGLLDAIRGDA